MLDTTERTVSRSPEAFFNAARVGRLTGGAISLYSTNLVATSLNLPIIFGAMIGIVSATRVSKHLSGIYDKLDLNPRVHTLCQFTISATTVILGVLLGLAATSLLVTFTMNPFTTPALIAGGVSAGLIVGLYVYAAMRVKSLALNARLRLFSDLHATHTYAPVADSESEDESVKEYDENAAETYSF